MKILYFDCFSGISGDMFLGAMLDIGVPESHLRQQLQLLPVSGYELVVHPDQRRGIAGTRVNVLLTGQDNHLDPHTHQHSHDDHHHGHHHDHQHDDDHHHGHHTTSAGLDTGAHNHDEHQHDRNFGQIRELINSSRLSKFVKELSLKIFTEIAKAEGKIHGKPMDEVHFHEVGALDSIVDIVGAAICVEYMKADQILFSPITVGSGFVKCAHGLFPVPAPATAELLRGMPILSGTVEKEMTTPTGAAIAKVLADRVTNQKEFVIERIGYGIGGRDNPIPNVLRVFLGKKHYEAIIPLFNLGIADQIIECNIDDCNPEIYPFVMERLLEAGAMDVWLTPIVMKKGRSAITLSVLCATEHVESLSAIIFAETTTIGLRTYPVTKQMLDRRQITLSTPYGEVNFKAISQNGTDLRFKPEFEDIKRIALDYQIPISQVYDAVTELYRSSIL